MAIEVRFDPQDIMYKKPFGAVPTGQEVALTLQVHRLLGAGQVFLLLVGDGGHPQRIEMPWDDTDLGWDCHGCTLCDLPTGLYWYWFEIDCDGQRRPFGAAQPWQLTVYDADYRTPDWFDAGVTYHIFVDRFHRSGDLPQTRPGRAYKPHERWDEPPDLYPKSLLEQNYDFFGGNLNGIREKLPYLESLGVTTLYLSPIFESFSNHRYDTGDYFKIDPLVGTEQDFRALCTEAAKRGMAVILDMVLNHTGSDSRYFNREGRYDTVGAAQSKDSPYYSWYSFDDWPDSYASWWGVMTLPTVDEADPGYATFTLGKDGVVPYWLKAGAAGYRLDVADELPREYLEQLRCAAKDVKPDTVIIGEVWEDASNKESYGQRRRYLLGQELDGVTNYPVRDVVLDFVRGDVTAAQARETLMALHENYPHAARRCLMNIIGTHDTVRVLNLLGCEQHTLSLPPERKATYRMTANERRRGKTRLMQAAALQYMLPGAPCLYYGDEVGLEGFEDPLCRRTFPWGNEDGDLLRWYRALGRLRRQRRNLFAEGSLRLETQGERVLLLSRAAKGIELTAIVNAAGKPATLQLVPSMTPVLGAVVRDGDAMWTLPAAGVAIFLREDADASQSDD